MPIESSSDKVAPRRQIPFCVEGHTLSRSFRCKMIAINRRANEMSVEEVRNKLRTLTQGQKSDKVVGLMANTFKALSELADSDVPAAAVQPEVAVPKPPTTEAEHEQTPGKTGPERGPSKPFTSPVPSQFPQCPLLPKMKIPLAGHASGSLKAKMYAEIMLSAGS